MTGSGTSTGSEPTKVKADGQEAILHITEQSVMFEKGGRISGFEKGAIRMIKPDGDAMIIAYSVGSEVKSVRVEPMTAVASLAASSPAIGQAQTSVDLDEIFEKLYRNARKELEEKLAKVESEPRNKSLRLTPEEEAKYSQISRQLENLLGNKYGFNPRAENSPMSFWGLERQPHGLQVDVIKTLHISFLRVIVSPRAEMSDIAYSATEVWPEDWERILVKFKLSDGPFLTEEFKRYLASHWTSHSGERKPVLARS